MALIVEQSDWNEDHPAAPGAEPHAAQLVLVFAETALLRRGPVLSDVRERYPGAFVFGCSTAGEILGTTVKDHSVSLTAITFERTRFRGTLVSTREVDDAFVAGRRLAEELEGEDLAHVLVLSDGVHVNGSELVKGLSSRLPAHVGVSGGLAGDGDRFEQTIVVFDGMPTSECVGAIGFYGTDLRVGCGSLGGWDPFGPERLVTRSEANILYELDGRSALDLYKSYLGEHADGLPATGLLYPLSLRVDQAETAVVRTLTGVDEGAQSMTFAGDVPEGSYVRLMKANFDRLVDGAYGAALASRDGIRGASSEFALLVSCVGRKMVLGQRIEEEVEAVRDVLGNDVALAGFYSYGEISPFTPQAKCELHNQTMTITTFSETI